VDKFDAVDYGLSMKMPNMFRNGRVDLGDNFEED
jgi:hypothetical protein